MDTLDPLQGKMICNRRTLPFVLEEYFFFVELISSRLPTVPEENQAGQQSQQQNVTWGYIDNSMSSATTNLQVIIKSK